MTGKGAKWRFISDELSAKIRSGEWPVGHRLDSEADIAVGWGVSRPTAHRAVAELQRDGLVVRQRRNGTVVADSRKKSTHMVGVVFDHVAKQFDFPQAELIQGIQEVLGKEFSLVWCDSMDEPLREANFLQRMSKETDGIICFPIADPVNTPLMQKLQKAGTPLVLLDRMLDGFDGNVIVSDDRDATRNAIKMLGDKGHQRIGFFGFYKPNVSSATARYEAYLAGMRDIGVEDPAPYCRLFLRQLEHEPDLFRQSVRDSALALLNPARPNAANATASKPITAIYCIQDSFANELINFFEELGVLVPEDVEVVVVHEWPTHLLTQADRMHRIVRQKREIGVAAAKRLLGLKAGETYEQPILRIPAELHACASNHSADSFNLVGAAKTNGG